jgi:hypothetical protein
MIHLGWSHPDARAAVGLMGGTYAEDNYAHELPMLRALYEAYAGVRVTSNLWLDAGLFPSHLGFESPLSIDNLNPTRSLSADGSPYYLAGARLTWTPTPRWALTAIVANGWQNMRETPDNRSKGGGTNLQYSPADGLTLSWSTWLSDEQPRDASALRFFNNLYATYAAAAWALNVGVDVGVQTDPASDDLHLWWTATATARADLTSWLAIGGRAERFDDPHGVVLGPLAAAYTGGSVNFDVHPVPDVDAWVRVEARALYADKADRFAAGPDGDRWLTTLFVSFATRFATSLPSAYAP